MTSLPGCVEFRNRPILTELGNGKIDPYVICTLEQILFEYYVCLIEYQVSSV